LWNLAISLLHHEVIKTTLAKAKALRPIVERLITLAKEDNPNNRRLAFDQLRNKKSVGKLFEKVAKGSKDRFGGYTRILKCGFRLNDSAPMAFIELIDRKNWSEEFIVAQKKALKESLSKPLLENFDATSIKEEPNTDNKEQ